MHVCAFFALFMFIHVLRIVCFFFRARAFLLQSRIIKGNSHNGDQREHDNNANANRPHLIDKESAIFPEAVVFLKSSFLTLSFLK